MARQVLPLVGAVAGFAVGGPTGAQIGFALGSLVGNAVDPIEMQGRKLGDAPTQVAAEGGARAIVYGKGCIRATCVIERGGRRVIRQRDRSGGKGGGPTTINERALWTFAIGLGEPVAAILRIWENEKLVYDVTPTSTIPEDTAQFAEKFRFYTGAEDQLPDPALEALHGAGNAPYYRGTAYMVFPQYDLTDFGETVPTYRVEAAASVEVTPVEDFWEFVQFVGDNVTGVAAHEGQWFISCQSPGEIWVGDGAATSFSEVAGVVPSGWSFASICSSGSRLLVRRDFNNALLKVGSSWFEATTANGDAYIVSLWTGERFLCMGHAGSSEWSEDGSSGTWSSVSIGVSETVRYGLVLGSDIVCAFTQGGSIRRTVNGGQAWAGVSTTGTDPNPSQPFTGAAFDGAVARGYKTINATTMVVYTSVDSGVNWVISVETVVSGEYNGGKIGVIDGKWVGALGSPVIYPNYPRPYVSSNGLPPFIEQEIVGGGSITSGAGGEIQHVFDDFDGVGLLVGDASEQSFVVRNRYDSSETVVGEPIELAVVISAMHQRCGHTAADYDVTEAVDLIAGVVIEQTVTAAEAINSLIGSHFIDPSDYDGKIHYINRGKPIVLTLTEDDLIDEPDEAQRNNAIEYPKKVHFLGQRADLAYASSKSTSARYSDDSKVVGEITIGSPETYDHPNSPAEVAVKLHKVLLTEAEGEREWVIPDNYLKLVPTDNVGLSYRGELVRCRILDIEDTPGQRKLRMIRDRQSAYTANLTEIPNPPAPTPPQSSVVAPTIMAFIDTSALTDNADSLHYLVALSGANDNWAGAVLQQQLGGDFTSIDSATLNAIMGVVQNTVSDASPYYTDTTNQVVVRLYTDDQLESRTDADFLSNGGAFFLSWEDSGQTQWEIMQFRDAVQDSNGDWVLSHLMRGRKNTETAEHPPGSTFVWIDPAILREPGQTAWIGTTLTHRAVSNGQSPELAVIQNNEYNGNSQREWPVADILLDHSDPDILAVEVIPRFRFGTSMNPIQSVHWTGLRITATDGVNTDTIDTTSFTHDFDVTGWGSPISVTVWQKNMLTGLSEPVTEEIP